MTKIRTNDYLFVEFKGCSVAFSVKMARNRTYSNPVKTFNLKAITKHYIPLKLEEH